MPSFVQIIEATKQFRVSWTELVQTASGMATDFDEIYQFIPSADPEDNAKYLPTSKEQLAKVEAYKEAMTELRNLMIQELASVERSVGMPAKDARKHIDVYRKFLKKREDRKVCQMVNYASSVIVALTKTIARLGTV